MRTKMPTITVGIPAYNEAGNIGLLLSDIKKQKLANFKLKDIVISSDGSTDKTNSIVKKFKGVKLFANTDRKGLSRGLNQIIDYTDTDVLIIFNADIRLQDPFTLSKLATEILYGFDLVSCPIVDYDSQTEIAKILSVSMHIKERIFQTLGGGINPYSCRGPARAFSKDFYKKLFFPTSIGEDMYSYFACIDKKMSFQYSTNTYVHYKLPQTFEDHKKQSIRFGSVRKLMSEFFAEELINAELKISMQDIVKGLISITPYLFKNSVYILEYMLITIAIKMAKQKSKHIQQVWQISHSSKAANNNFV